MHVRVVRFTDVDADRAAALLARVEAADGPPAGVDTTALKILIDEAQGTAVVLQYFETAAAMAEGARVFEAMDVSDTPGTRASVDHCEIRLELEAT